MKRLKEKDYKVIEYTILLAGVAAFGFMFWLFRYNNSARLLLTSLSVLFYVLWGVVHHFIEKRLTLEIAVEYVLIGFLTFLLVLVSLSV
ncbi:hypothetical protein ACFLZK_01750 [Patescibacteria group bacterium]